MAAFWRQGFKKTHFPRTLRACGAPEETGASACLALQKSRNPLRKAAFKWSERIPPLSPSAGNRARAPHSRSTRIAGLGGKIERLAERPILEALGKGVATGFCGGCKGDATIVRSGAAVCVICRGGLDAQPAGAASAAVEDFRRGVDEPFARRHFGFPLRGRGWRIARDVAILRVRLPLRRKYFAVRQVWKRHIRHMRRRPRAACNFGFSVSPQSGRNASPPWTSRNRAAAQIYPAFRCPLRAVFLQTFFRVWTGQEG